MASAQKRNPSRPGSATARPGSAKDSARNAQAQAAESGVFRCSMHRASAPPVDGRREEAPEADPCTQPSCETPDAAP